MVSGHLQVKKGYYYAVLSYYDSRNKRHVKYDLPKRETNEKRKQNSHASAASLSRRRRWESLLPICLLRIICFRGWTS